MLWTAKIFDCRAIHKGNIYKPDYRWVAKELSILLPADLIFLRQQLRFAELPTQAKLI